MRCCLERYHAEGCAHADAKPEYGTMCNPALAYYPSCGSWYKVACAVASGHTPCRKMFWKGPFWVPCKPPLLWGVTPCSSHYVQADRAQRRPASRTRRPLSPLQPADIHTTNVVCDGDMAMALQCEQGKQIGSIVSAFYGRFDTTTCPTTDSSAMASTSCSSPDFKSKVHPSP